MTERRNGGPGAAASAWVAGRAARASGPAAPARAAAVQAPKNWRRRTLNSQQFIADILQNVKSSFHADFPGENGVFVFDAENALIAHIHVGLQDVFPGAGAMAVADGSESFRGGGQVLNLGGEIQN